MTQSQFPWCKTTPAENAGRMSFRIVPLIRGTAPVIVLQRPVTFGRPASGV